MTFNPCLRTGKRNRHTLGHILVHCPDHPGAQRHGYVPEHRLIMERSLGRYLLPGDKVRHRNGDKTDNRVENLELVPAVAIDERFWSKVEKGDGCWEWKGRRHKQGYGVFWIGRTILLAHRVAYRLATGDDPGANVVCHRCDNPPCVRPDHLFLGSQQQNMADMSRKRRRHRLSHTQVEEARLLLAVGAPVAEVAQRFGVAATTVQRDCPVGGPRGEHNAKATLREWQVRDILARHARGEHRKILAAEYGVGLSAIDHIVARRSWRHIDFDAAVADQPDRPQFSADDIAALLDETVLPLFPQG
jgi:hypothetical protein